METAVDGRISGRARSIQAPMIPIVGKWMAEHPGTLSLGQGIVSYGPPPPVARAVAKMADEAPVHRYGPVGGLPALREALAGKLRQENGIPCGPDQRVIVTAGSNMAFLNAVTALCDAGDEVVILSPYYFNHEMAITMIGARPRVVPADANHQIDFKALEAAVGPRTRALVTISPNNPTGAVYREQDLRAVNDLCRRRGIYHLCDEAYEYFVYGDRRHFSPGSLPGSAGHTISLYSFSKGFGMAGWRVGYMVVPAAIEEAIQKIQDTNLICPPQICQRAALAALEAGSGYCREKAAALAGVRELVLESLGRLGEKVQVPRPDGAFYAMIGVQTARRDLDLVRELIARHGVGVMPGCTFGLTEGCFVRISYGALQKDSVAEAMQRLVRGLNELA